MQIRNLLLSFSIIAGLFFSSCESYLQPGPENFSDEKRITEDAAFAEGVLLNAYSAIPDSYSFEETATDDGVTNDMVSSNRRIALGEWSSQYNPFSIWNQAYSRLYYINYLLKIMDDVIWSWENKERNESFRKRFTGEALAFRAWYNFELLKNHGGIDANGNAAGFIILKPENYSNQVTDIPRDSYEACLQFIIDDCNEAMALLPDEYKDIPGDIPYNLVFGKQNVQRINGMAVKALKARTLLHVASMPFYNAPDKWAKAADAAAVLINSTGGISGLSASGVKWYSSENDKDIIWRDIYKMHNLWEKENFPPGLYGSGRVNPSQNLVDVFPMANGIPIKAPGSGYDENQPYLNRDPRLGMYIIYDGNSIGSNTVQTNTEAGIDGINNTPTSTRTGYYLKKFMNEEVNLDPKVNSSRRHFYTFFRFTEMFLIYAEVANEAWGPDGDPRGNGYNATSVIGALRKRAGITQPDQYLSTASASTDQMRELIRNERRIELCFEGFRFWDIRRWGMPLNESVKGVMISESLHNIIEVEKRQYQPYMLYGPIPYSETLKNNKLIQNAGW